VQELRTRLWDLEFRTQHSITATTFRGITVCSRGGVVVSLLSALRRERGDVNAASIEDLRQRILISRATASDGRCIIDARSAHKVSSGRPGSLTQQLALDLTSQGHMATLNLWTLSGPLHRPEPITSGQLERAQSAELTGPQELERRGFTVAPVRVPP
jgi:hypothetical protein